jgi:hypothetical protein
MVTPLAEQRLRPQPTYNETRRYGQKKPLGAGKALSSLLFFTCTRKPELPRACAEERPPTQAVDDPERQDEAGGASIHCHFVASATDTRRRHD